MKKFLTMLLSILVVVAIAIYGLFIYDRFEHEIQDALNPTNLTTTTMQGTSVTSIEGDPLAIELLDNGLYYDALSPYLQEQYRHILDTLLAHSGDETIIDNEPGLTIVFPTPINSHADAESLYFAVYNDHPELFYLTGRSSCVLQNGRCISLTIYYSMSLIDRQNAALIMNREVAQLVNECEGLSEFETELYLHDTLLERCTYNEAAAESGGDSALHIANSSPFSAIYQGEAICGGYTRAMQLLLNRAGIQSTAVYGEDHVWNMVWIDGKPYHLDATWNDAESDLITHHFFNVTYEDMLHTRKIDTQGFRMPHATAIDANYHRYFGYYYDGNDFESDAFESMFMSQVKNGSLFAEIRFPAKYYQDATTFFASEAFSEMFYDLIGTAYDSVFEEWRTHTYYSVKELGIVTFIAWDQ